MKKWIGIIIGCIVLNACDSYTTDFEGKWQLTEVESADSVIQVDTVWYNYQTSIFQYQIYDRSTDEYLVVYGYHAYEDEELSIELFQSTELEKAFLSRTDWFSAQRVFTVEKLSGKQMILTDDGKRYIFRKY